MSRLPRRLEKPAMSREPLDPRQSVYVALAPLLDALDAALAGGSRPLWRYEPGFGGCS